MPYTQPTSIARRRAMAREMMSNQRRKAPVENILKALGAYQGGRFAAADEAANSELKQKEMAQLLRAVTNDPESVRMQKLSDLSVLKGTDVAGTGEGAYTHPEVQAMELQRQMAQQATQGAQSHDMAKIVAKGDQSIRGIDAQGRNQQANIGLQGTNQIANTKEGGIQARLTELLKQEGPIITADGEQLVRPNKEGGADILHTNTNFKPATPFGDGNLIKAYSSSKQAQTDQDMMKESGAAYEKLRGLGQLKTLSEKSGQGALQPVFTAAQNVLVSLGMTTDQVKNTQVMASELAGMKRSDMEAMGARGLTDADMKILTENLPSMNYSHEARLAVIGVLERIQHNKVKQFEGRLNAAREGGIPEVLLATPRWLNEYNKTYGGSTSLAGGTYRRDASGKLVKGK